MSSQQEIKVKYNDFLLYPTPLVNRGNTFLDYGGRHGVVDQIILNAYLTNISGVTGSIGPIVDIFSGQFGTLEVFGNQGESIHKWTNCVVEEIDFSSSPFVKGTQTPYSVKLHAYNLPSGVIDPVNEYSFTQNTDDTIDVSHKISARGIRTFNGALDNAIAFVKQFTGQNPHNYCPPAFMASLTGIRMSINESIDRQAGIYSVNEVYKYSTGGGGYLDHTSVTINDSKSADYTIISLETRRQGSPLDNNLAQVQYSITGANLNTLLNDYGIDTTSVYINSLNLAQNSGTSSISLKIEYYSGISNDYSGYFDYTVSLDKDFIINQTAWKIDGEFICKGPTSFRKTMVAAFKSSYNPGMYIPYLGGLISGSALYLKYGSFPISSIINSLSVAENTGLATLKLSASFTDEDSLQTFIKPTYNVSVEPSIWVYETLPSANIEGHYIIQDLQMQKQAKIGVNFESESPHMTQPLADSADAVVSSLLAIYTGSAFLTSYNITTGLTNVNISTEVLGKEAVQTDVNSSKVYGSIVSDYHRPPGFKFGY